MNINIRNANIHDARQLLKIYEPYVLGKRDPNPYWFNIAITFEYDVPSLDEFKNRIQSITKKYPYLVAESNKDILGYAYASVFKDRAAYDWSVEVSIYIKQDMKKHGIGKMLYTELERRLKEQNILNVYACIAYPERDDEYLDKNSAQFHKHLGYRRVGTFRKCGYKFGRWYNMVWYEKFIGKHK